MDALVVGCGLSGAVIARYLAEICDKKVIVWERRNHIGGNMYDYYDKYGILVHKYGPHTFHTNKEYLYDFMCRYGKWIPYKLKCGAVINGKYTPTPFNFQTIDDFYPIEEAKDIKSRIKSLFGNRTTVSVLEVLNCRDEKVRSYAEFLFKNDYSLYTAKQWGVPANEIDQSVLERVPLRFSYEEGYFDDKFEYMPATTYNDFFRELLNHDNIDLQLGIDALKHIAISDNKIFVDGKQSERLIVYTGALDELFGLCEGKLPYRSLRFEWKHENIQSKQNAAVVAYPQEPSFTRITEYNKLPLQNSNGTTYAVEYSLPYEEGKVMEPYYPVLTIKSNSIYEKYLKKASQVNNFYFCGRLADFKYYNMDQALERALNVCNTIEI